MAVPKKKASKSRTRRRYVINSALDIPELYRDQQSGALVRRHHLNSETGAYRDTVYVVHKVREKKPKAVAK